MAKNDGYPYLSWQVFELPPPDEFIPESPTVIRLWFRSGNSDRYPMGTFHVDKTEFRVKDPVIKVDGRNTIGKYLLDQSFDELNTYEQLTMPAMVEDILINAGLARYMIGTLPEEESSEISLQFSPNMTFWQGLQDLLKMFSGWIIKETLDGRVIVAHRDSGLFDPFDEYTFYRNKDIFSRTLIKDDYEVYSKVCVHDREFNIKKYKRIPTELGWSPPTQKTYYAEVPYGISEQEVDLYLDELTELFAGSGNIEVFYGPFRPHLQHGDQATIVNTSGEKSLGFITDIRHEFGKRGFYTQFTVDSGGKIGRPRISDFITDSVNKFNIKSTTVT